MDIEEFLKKVSDNARTRKIYGMHLKHYFSVLNVKSKTYFDSKRDYENDIENYVEYIRKPYLHKRIGKVNKDSPLTCRQKINAIKQFFIYNRIDLPSIVWKQALKHFKGGKRGLTHEWVPNRKELKEVLSGGGVKDKAIFLLLSSSGIRPDEALALEFDDIDFNKNPVEIKVPALDTKTGQRRTTFMSTEAKFYLEQWIKKYREKYDKIASLRSTRHQRTDYGNKIFNYGYDVARDMWNKLITKAGFDKKDKNTGWYQMRLYTLRKYFKNQLINNDIPFEVVESMMGHEDGARTTYIDRHAGRLKDWYLKGEKNLLVFELPPNQEELDNMQKQISGLQEQMKGILEFERKLHTKEVDLETLEIKDKKRTVDEILIAYDIEKQYQKSLEQLTEKLGDEDIAKELIKKKKFKLTKEQMEKLNIK